MSIVCLCTIGLLAAFFLRQTLEIVITVSAKCWKRLLLLFSCWLLLGMIIYIGDPINILLTISFFLLSVQIACEGSFWKRIAIGMIFSSTVFAFSTLRDNFVLTIDIRCERPGEAVLASTLYTLFFVFLLYAGVRKFAPNKEYSLSDSMWKLLLLLTATPSGIVLSVVILHGGNMYDDKIKTTHNFEYAILLLIALVSIIGLLWAVTVLAKQQKLEEQSILAQINNTYYSSMEEQHFAIRRLKHDLANHLLAVTAMPEEQRELYIKSLTEDSAVTKSLQYCGDTTVNAVLTVKEEQMKRYGIRLNIEIAIPEVLPYKKTDVCALFANALDNAAEACRKVEQNRREVLLKTKAQKGLFCLEVTNPVRRAAEESDGGAVKEPDNSLNQRGWKADRFPQTSKPDKANHGIGLRSMREIVERYHGAMDLKADEESFEVFLYMPLRTE